MFHLTAQEVKYESRFATKGRTCFIKVLFHQIMFFTHTYNLPLSLSSLCVSNLAVTPCPAMESWVHFSGRSQDPGFSFFPVKFPVDSLYLSPAAAQEEEDVVVVLSVLLKLRSLVHILLLRCLPSGLRTGQGAFKSSVFVCSCKLGSSSLNFRTWQSCSRTVCCGSKMRAADEFSVFARCPGDDFPAAGVTAHEEKH